MNNQELTRELVTNVRHSLSIGQSIDDQRALEIIADQVFGISHRENLDLEQASLLIKKIFFKTRTKLGILTPLIEDEEVSEIMVNGIDKIFYERQGRIHRWDMSFDREEELEEVMQSIAAGVHREINELNPIVDARLADGSRVNGVYKNIAISGPTLTIRKFSDKHMRLRDLEANGTLTKEAVILLSALVRSGYNLFVSGGTSSGKTTLLNALSEFIEPQERVIVIEDSTELKLGYIENLVQMECRQDNASGRGRVTMASLIKSSLRMRPDRIIVGEVRGEEVVDMLQAMNTGHSGSMSTGHGNSARAMLKRLETMYLMAIPLEVEAIRAQIAEGIDIMIHVERLSMGRRITDISELVGYEKGRFILNPLMELDQEGRLKPTGNHIRNIKKLKVKEGKGEKITDELQRIGIIP